jgi:hypothetical protein
MRRGITVFVIVVVIGFICISGCTNKNATEQILVQTIPTTTLVTPSPIEPQTSTPTIAPTTIGQTITPNQTETTIPKVHSYNQADPDFSINIKNSVLAYTVSNCIMKEVFPTIANDVNYGLKASPSKLTGISDGEWNRFIREYTEGKNENSKTIGISRCNPPLPESPKNPWWNFIKISGQLTPRNPIPADYEIVIHIKGYGGNDVGQVKMNEKLYQDQPIQYVTYIPMRNDEIEMFNTATITFNK